MCYVDNLCSQRRLEGSIFTIGTYICGSMWIISTGYIVRNLKMSIISCRAITNFVSVYLLYF